MTGIMMSMMNSVSPLGIVPGAVLNLDPSTGLSGNTWINTGSLGTGLNYTLINGPTTTTVNGFTVLDFSGGASQFPPLTNGPYAFNGTGFTTLASASQPFTLDIWACPQAANAGCLIKEWGQSAGGIPTSGWEDAWINFENGSINSSVYPYPINPADWLVGSYTVGTWYNVTMSYNGSNQLLVYLNGTLASTQSVVREGPAGATRLSVAACEVRNYISSGGPYFTGQVGAFKLYYSQLTADQIDQNFQVLRARYGV